MKVYISECLGSPGYLFQLLSNYNRIDKLVEDILNQKVCCHYLDFGICFNNCWYWIRHNGEFEKDFPINKLKNVKTIFRCIPNDTMVIKCDEFERELYIDLDGDDDND